MNSTEAHGQGILLIVNLNEHSNSINYSTDLSIAEQLVVEVARRDGTQSLVSFAFHLGVSCTGYASRRGYSTKGCLAEHFLSALTLVRISRSEVTHQSRLEDLSSAGTECIRQVLKKTKA